MRNLELQIDSILDAKNLTDENAGYLQDQLFAWHRFAL